MAQRAHVPKFGNWEGEENVPYTVFFEKARKGRGGPMINPNDPEQNPALFSKNDAPPQPTPYKAKPEPEEMGKGPGRRPQGAERSRGEADFKQFAESPAHQEQPPPNPRYGGRGVDLNRRSGRPNPGLENNFEKSPLHHQVKNPGRGQPPPDAKSLYTGYNAGRGSRLRQNPMDDIPSKGTAVPRFGDWDENNPASADGYTHIFNKVREEKHLPGKAPETNTTPQYERNKPPSDSARVCCFAWGRK